MIGERRAIAVADFNHDGNPDLLDSSRTGDRVVWYANPDQPSKEPWRKTVIDSATKAPAREHPTDLEVVMPFGIAAGAGQESHQDDWYENLGRPGS